MAGGETARGEREDHESRTERNESAAGDLRLRAAAEHGEHEQEPQDQAGADRGKDDQPDVTSLANVCSRRGTGAVLSDLCSHATPPLEQVKSLATEPTTYHHRPQPGLHDPRMPHIIRKPGFLGGTTLAVFMTLVHTVNDAITAILGAMLPTLQVRFDAGPTTLALMVAVFWIASSVTQPVFGALGEDIGLRVIGCVGVLMASTFLSLIGVASELWLVFVLLVIGGLGSAALHPVGTTIASTQASNATLGVGLFTAGGMVGFALGPVLILYLVSTYGSDATVWLAVPGLILGLVWAFSYLSGNLIRVGPFGGCSTCGWRAARSGCSPSRACSARWRSSRSQAPSRSGSCKKMRTHPTRPSSGGRSQRSLSRAASARSSAAFAPRLGPVLTIVGALLLTLGPLLAVSPASQGQSSTSGRLLSQASSFSCPCPRSSSSRRSSCRAHPRRHQEWFSGLAQPWLGSGTSCSGAFRRRWG